MEETQLNTPLISQKCADLEVVQWQWQSDSNPYKETDPTKWTWQNYSDDENLVIEAAYLLNPEGIVNLKDYEIDLKKLVQVSNQDKNKVRRVRRQKPSRFMMDMPEVNAIKKTQKTMNEAFGNVQHFLEYIMKRTRQAFALYQKLGKLSLDCNRAEFESLVCEVLTCIEKGAETRAKIIKTRTSSRKASNYILEAGKIKDAIERDSSTLRDFLRTILKTYTMETFICYWLNELLRSEDWEEINVLTPYLVCLVYTFKLSDYVLQSQNSQKEIDDRFGFNVKYRLYLYRGAALTEEQLMKYNPKMIKYFSWNAVTSTSRDRNEATKFVHLSVDSVRNIRVMFFIEIDFDSLEDYHGMIDLSKYSRFPNEQEVILAPGTVFELLEISLIENEIYEIRLKVTKNVKEAQEDVTLLGILQNQAIFEDQALIDGLHTKKGCETLKLLAGNKLIRKLEIKNSRIPESLIAEIEGIRRTTNVQKEDIKLVDNTICVSSVGLLVEYFSTSNLSDILRENQISFGSEVGQSYEIEKGSPFKSLILRDETIEMFRKDGKPKEIFQGGLQNEIQIKGITLSLHKMQKIKNELKDFLKDLSLKLNERQAALIKNLDELCEATQLSVTLNYLSLNLPFTNEGLSILQGALLPLESLENLEASFGGSNQVPNGGSHSLWSGLGSLTSLKHLSLSFWKCDLSDRGLSQMNDALRSLASLQHLYLGFKSCNTISDEGLGSLKITFASLTTLEHLSCDIFACSQISSEGLNYLMHEFSLGAYLKHLSIDMRFCRQVSNKKSNYLENALVSLKSSQCLSLDLKFWRQPSDQEINSLRFMKSCQFFHSLSLNFRKCQNISNEGFYHLKNALKQFNSLQSLSLSFKKCKRVSDEGLRHLRDALLSLKSLQNLCLHFRDCRSISNRGLYYLWNALRELTSLKCLSLRVNDCSQISDSRLNDLQSVLISMKSLKSLSLDFNLNMDETSDEGLDPLLSTLTSSATLKDLNLRFGRGIQISDQGLNYLKSALVSLAFLENLSLLFCGCKFSNEGFDHLKNGLKSLQALKSLSLYLVSCEYSDEGSNVLVSALASLTTLKHLDLRFWVWGINQIFDSELCHLKNALVPLTSLQNLSISFSGDALVSDKGLENLKYVLTSLSYLQHLSLHFDGCKQISDEGLGHLKIALMSPIDLQHLSLSFNDCTKISDQGLSSLKSAIRGLKSLQHLSLDFGYSPFINWASDKEFGQISDEGFCDLQSALIPLSSLHQLSLSFRKCKISDKSLDQLKRTIALLTSLKQLTLTIWAPDVISDAWLNHLKSAFAPLTSLEYLSLNFMECCQISDKGLNYLQSTLMPLSSLQHLSLNFSYCYDISNGGLYHLQSAFILLPSLLNVSLDFYRCDDLSKKRLNRFKNELKCIPSLKIKKER